MTGAAFASANANLSRIENNARRSSGNMSGSFRNLGQAVLSVRNVVAGLGVVLSARALGTWALDATRSTQVTLEQRAAFDGAAEALGRLNQEIQGRSLPLLADLATALERSAEGWRRFLFPTDEEATVDRMTELNTMIVATQARIDRLKQGDVSNPGRLREIQEAAAAVRGYRSELDELWEARKRQLGGPGAAGDPHRTGTDNPFSVGDFDMDAFLGEMNTAVAERQAAAAAAAKKQEFDLDAFLGEMNVAVLERQAQAAEQEEEEAERRREQLARRLDDVQLFALTEIEFEEEQHARRQEILDEALAERLLSQDRHSQLSIDLARITEQTISEIQEHEARKRQQLQLAQVQSVSNLFGGLAAIAAVGAERSKKQFELHKKLSTAEAIVSTLAGVARALKEAPYPINLINAAAVAAFGFAQVARIRSTSWQGEGGGAAGGFAAGGGGAGSFSSPGVPALTDQTRGGRSQMVVNVVVQGSVIGEGGRTALAEDLTRLLRDHTERTDDTLISVRSRNAADLLEVPA